jgi:cytochrome c peroxidase
MRAIARSFLIAAFWYAAIAFAGPESAEYAWRLPPGFPAPLVPADNPMSDAKVALGCRLFSETQLSITRQYSCASCHRAELAFTDGRARALGAQGDSMQRGAMSLANVAYNTAFTWASDRVVTLEAQMEQPLFNNHPIEMGLHRDDPAVLAPLAESTQYRAVFRKAFPGESEPITMTNVIKAIAAYERTLIQDAPLSIATCSTTTVPRCPRRRSSA